MDKLKSFFLSIWNNIGPIIASVLVLAFLIVMALAFHSESFIAKLGDQDFARGLITFIISVSTIVLGFILVTSSLFGASDAQGQEAENRFRRGREVFAGLLGVLGTIVGFYFGAAQQSPRELQ